MTASPNKAELRALLALGLPAAGTQLARMLSGMVDTIMVGRLSTHALDAAALGHLWIYGTAIFALGLTWGMDPILSQAHGAGDGQRAGRTVQRGVVLVFLMTPLLWFAWSQTEPVMLAFGQSPAHAADAARYVSVQRFSIVPFLGFSVARQYLQARGIVMPALWAVLAANLFNVCANWALIFGHLGLPAMGVVGAGLATGLTRCFTLTVLVGWIVFRGLHRGAWTPPTRAVFSPTGLWEIVRLGLPIGFMYALEGWAFQVSSLMSGRLGEAELAAHTIALNLASTTFMIPMGLSQGAATRVGNLVGANRPEDAARAARLSLIVGASVMVLSATVFLVFRTELPRLYTEDRVVIGLAAATLPIAGAFQIFDGLQVTGGAILRGVGATRPAAVFNLIAYYVLALPLGATLAFSAGWGLAGIWWGLCVGLGIVAAALLWWIAKRVRYTRLDETPTRR